ncbi:hypothetical protein PIB30_110678, partial [Stylosanthes scabra]|nr:hypothetical protein [Stylosanthes scabra]
ICRITAIVAATTNTANSIATVNPGAPNSASPPPIAEATANPPIPYVQAAEIELSQLTMMKLKTPNKFSIYYFALIL